MSFFYIFSGKESETDAAHKSELLTATSLLSRKRLFLSPPLSDVRNEK